VFPVAGARHTYSYAEPREGAPATGVSSFGQPTDIAPMSDGSFLMAAGSVVYRVGRLGRIARVAGIPSSSGYRGDGGPARNAHLGAPSDLAVTSDGGFLIADSQTCAVRRVDAGGRITTVAGRGPLPPNRLSCTESPPAAEIGDGGPATLATLSPTGVSSTPDGGILIADGAHGRVRRVDPSGNIHTVVSSRLNEHSAVGCCLSLGGL
jgi:hypothetical protein